MTMQQIGGKSVHDCVSAFIEIHDIFGFDKGWLLTGGDLSAYMVASRLAIATAPPAYVFSRVIGWQELDLHDISLFDEEFGKTLQKLQAFVCRKQYLESIHDQKEILNLRSSNRVRIGVSIDFQFDSFKFLNFSNKF